ncbi:MAG: hydantoinase B/oxoprolinase family protein [Polymorphobacter sp.]|uniref:hydantoinase B/oxoprolinase family protein n=1 Tax=Polymorphobacter sp. TaxID=1909290 RepID=UPI003A8B4A63
MSGWRVAIDRGGTFTDVVAQAPDGRTQTMKLLSHAPEQYDDAALEAIRRLGGGLEAVRMGTTVATNALLERKGAPTLLAVTKGHADALTIGHQARADIFALDIVQPAALQADTIEITERLDARGTIIVPLDEAAAEAALRAAHARGLSSLAVALLHAWANPVHELRLAEIARSIGFAHVTTSHETGRLIKFVPRGQTALVDAYLSPALGQHVARVEAGLTGTPLAFMQSSGGLAAPGHFHGRSAVLSGPAGGIVGLATIARQTGRAMLIGFDMGGTSTDVSLYTGRFDRTSETEIAGQRIQTPSLRIDTVAAGGGSIVSAHGQRLRVGPESAGARPGPAAYGHGGPLTITDCNVALGRLQREHFPKLFGPSGDAPLDTGAVEARLAALAETLGMDPLDLAEGAVAVAVETMAAAIKAISISRGHSPSDATLVGFGGAAGQHVCAVADALGIDEILLHPLAGVLSAWGIGMADVSTLAEATLALPLRAGADGEIEAAASRLAGEAEAALAAQGHKHSRTQLIARLRHKSSDTVSEFPVAPAAELVRTFLDDQARRFRLQHDAGDVILESLAAEAISETHGTSASFEGQPPQPPRRHPVRFGGAWHDTPFHHRPGLAPGTRIAGPAVLLDDSSTTLIAPGWQGEIDAAHNLILRRAQPVARPRPGTALDPVWLALFANRFMGIAEEMGAALQATAWSVNIKERLDFSCAVFDASGALIANAPHMPVHLGSMGASVRAVIAANAGQIRPGHVYMLNDPHAGGTHLPDVTVVEPVFLSAEDSAPAYWVAARGHHADIGGTTPGSMPADSRHIDEEGVRISNWLLADADGLREAETLALLAPTRNPARCLGDLKAQRAACARGADALRALSAEVGADTVAAYMAHVQDDAEAAVRTALARLTSGRFEAPMDNGARIRVALTIETDSATLDFTGTSAQTPDNFNAPEAVTQAAALYALRCLAGGDLPLNEGCQRPLRLIIPKGSILSPDASAAVVAGNVETSQILTDAILAAMGQCAAAQGTMNNLTFGNAAHQYYETIAGGAGATPRADGASAVQTHMTNSRLTDPEILEARFPVRVERFAVRRGSGGAGRHKGGDGVIRTLTFLEPMTVSLLSGRRLTAPFGLEGGESGQRGAAFITRQTGTTEPLGPCARAELLDGDSITIETPGGGGYGGGYGGGFGGTP